MQTVQRPEAWLRGPVVGVPPLLMPVAHALIQAEEDLARIASELSHEQVWARPGNAASVGFHLRHVAGSMDRLFTYARGEALSRDQHEARVAETASPEDRPDVGHLLDTLHRAVAAALDQLRHTPDASLTEVRGVGRAQVPSTVIGLLFHAAEHAQRHAGQALATAKAAPSVQPQAR